MGLWNLISKGVTVSERKPPKRKRKTEDEIEVQLTQPEAALETDEPPAEEPTLDLSNADYAAQILFDAPPPNPYGSPFQSAFAGAAIANRNILVVTPLTDRDEVSIVEHLRNTNEAVIVCFEGLSIEDAHKRLNFLRGVACALRGIIKPLDRNKVIITPSGVGIKK